MLVKLVSCSLIEILSTFSFVLFLDAFCVASLLFVAVSCATDDVKAESKNETAPIVDPFEADGDLRFAADAFCREYITANPRGQKVALPYKPNCHFWWECSAFELKKMECQGLHNKILLHYDLYLDRCDMPSDAKCSYQFNEEEIIMEEIMQYYKKEETK